MPEWTAEQKAAIELRGASLVVSAAAGSGKTSVLVARLIALLSDTEHRMPAERLVVVTFTNDAAAEMRRRLTKELTKAVREHPENEWLRQQQTMLQSAKISTIHSFCYALMREHFQALDISANFRTLEDSEENVLRADAAQTVLEEFSRRAEEDADTAAKQQLLLDAFCGSDDSSLDGILNDLHRYTEQKPFGGDLPARAADALESGSFAKRAAKIFQSDLESVLSLLKAAQKGIVQSGTEKQIAGIGDDISCAELALKHCQAEQYAELGTVLANKLPAKVNTAGKLENAVQIRALWKHAKRIWEARLMPWRVPFLFAEADIPRTAAILRALQSLLDDFTAELNARKQERDAVSFADAMRMTLSLLAERREDGSIVRTPLAEALSEQFVCIMVDEFQDADDQQDLIFRMLSHGGSPARYGSNMFTVGDSKQCIYRFRNANPQNFAAIGAECTDWKAEQGTAPVTENTRVLLNSNFRSADPVISIVNHVFSMLMTQQVGEVDYDDTQKLIRGAVYFDGDRRTEIMLLHDTKSVRADEPAAVADCIRRHLRELHTPVADKEAPGGVRPCRAGDFLILLRNKTHMGEYAEALRQHGIPVGPAEEGEWLKAPEILLLLEILRVIDNPLLDVSAAAAMLSPVFGFSSDDLAALRIFDRSHELCTVVRTFCKEPPADADPALTAKCSSFLAFLDAMRLFSAMETPEQLIRRIYQETDLLGLMQMNSADGSKKANLRMMLRFAGQFEQSRGGGLSAFLRYLAKLGAQKKKIPCGTPPAGAADAVSVMTIHGSKGLEAPFVILARSNSAFSRKDALDVIQYHSDLGFGFRLLDPANYAKGDSLPSRAIIAQNYSEMLSEELRLLYVALTRAREHLILPLVYTDKYGETAAEYAAEQEYAGGQTDLLTASAGCMRDWLVMSLIRNTACEQLRRTLNVTCETDGTPALDVCFSVITPEPSAESEQSTDAQEIAPDAALLETLRKQCEKQYDSRLAGLTAKYGVSELARAENITAPLRRPQFVREKHGLSGAERGTAVHTFMQYADFAAAKDNLPGEVERLTQRGRLTQRQAQAVLNSTIGSFFTSPLFDRIQRAKTVWREEKFTVRLSDLHLTGALAEIGEAYAGTEGMLIGIMDLVIEEDDGIVLIDYKTDHAQADALLEEYTTQIRLYAEALRLLKDKPVRECCLYSVYLNQVIPVPTE